MKKQGTCQVNQQVSIQYFWFLFLWQDIVKICSSLTWSRMIDTVCFLLLTINKILNPFSLAADFVRFFVRFGPVRTDIFVCAVILVRKYLAILVEEAELPVRFVLRHIVSCESFVYIFARPENLPVLYMLDYIHVLTGNHAI